MRQHLWRLTVLMVAAMPLAVVVAQGPTKVAMTLYLNEERSWDPGYPIGDVYIPNPRVVDAKVLSGRKTIMLFGRGLGEAVILVQDQKKETRHELAIRIVDKAAMQAESDLKAVLKDIRGVEVRWVGTSLAVSGTVSSREDFEAVERIANAVSAKNLVRLAPSSTQMPTAGPGTVQAPVVARPPAAVTPPGAAPAGAGAPASGAAAPATATTKVEYVVDIVEASVGFRTGSYSQGVEPSGSRLFQQKIVVPLGETGEIYATGKVFARQRAEKIDADEVNAAADAGLRIKLTPTKIDVRPMGNVQQQTLSTAVLIETNLPIGIFKIDTWRRSRWEVEVPFTIPFGFGGRDLLAVDNIDEGKSGASRVGDAARHFIGISPLGGSTAFMYGSAASGYAYYDKKKKTQLMAIIRPTVVQ